MTARDPEDIKSPFMTAKETAKYLQIHKITLYRLVKENKLPFFRIGGKGSIRFKLDDLERVLMADGDK